jgi:hypothetical protein
VSLFRRKQREPEGDGFPDELRSASRRLRGWTVSGSGLDIDRLLDRAADEIEALRADSQPEEPT